MKLLFFASAVASTVFPSTHTLEQQWPSHGVAAILQTQVHCRNCSEDRNFLQRASKTKVTDYFNQHPHSTFDTEHWLYRGLWYDEFSGKYYNVCQIKFGLVGDDYGNQRYEVIDIGFSGYFGR